MGKAGRPKGAKSRPYTGLSFDKRMRVLQKIILDPNEKTCDRLMAIKTMTDSLQDKVKDSSKENPVVNLKFISENITKSKENNAIIGSNTNSQNVTPPVVQAQPVVIQPVIDEELKVGFVFNTEAASDKLDE
jgi:uncharacterized protein YjaZ